jgi:hypothetical protein
LEFRLSSAVQPNRVHKILYAGTLHSYICADLIGKTLVDKTPTPVQLLVTDMPACLDLRLRLEVPVVWAAQAHRVENAIARADTLSSSVVSPPAAMTVRDGLHCHAHYSNDVPLVHELLDRLVGNLDLTEPFCRIREAINEARKMGVSRN